MKRANLFSYVFLLAVGVVGSGFFEIKTQTPEGILLYPVDDIRQLSSYERVSRSVSDQHMVERSKIDYLIEAIRNSSFVFVRNGSPYSGKKAAAHLMWKYHQQISRIETAQEFVEKIGTRSSLSGEFYLVKYSNGHTYPLRDILLNELHRLENCLGQNNRSNL